MDVNKNSYTFSFAAIMVVVVAALLSTAAIALKPFQSRNVLLEKKQNILSSVGINIQRDEADLKYPSIIKEELVLNNKGEKIDGIAFDIDLQKELKKNPSEQSLPLYISEIDGKKQYIIPLRGKGLWGPIWGFISLEDDLNKVFGAVFDHKTETPGLGAEINMPFFQDPFVGKTIFERGDLFN
jgi:Na+-transporting NADH:ubiquinone oxidoreductase subunit C